jgi:hypothetical protein
MTWLFNHKEVTCFEDLDAPTAYGFIYEITYVDGTKYLGKKNFFKQVKLPALKSGKQRPDSTRTYKNLSGKRVYYDVVQKPSNWLSYSGSSELTTEKTILRKEILALAYSKRELTYLEVKYLFLQEVLESDLYLNSNILGKFFKLTKDANEKHQHP